MGTGDPASAIQEAFEYSFTRLDPVRGDHVDPPSVAIFETLLRKGPDGRPLPGLAQSWRTDAEQRTWYLRLRPGVRFHSGAACDASSVVAALDACRWGDGLPRQVWYWDPVDSVCVIDEETIAIRLHYPCSRLPVLLWGTHTAIANPDSWHRLGTEFGEQAADGTGPYRLIHFTATQVKAERVGPGLGPQQITWTSVPDDAERRVCLEDPAYDVVRYVDPAQCLDPARLPDGWRCFAQHENSQFTLALDFDDPRGFGDVEMRRCFDGLIDRELLLATALHGFGDARRSPIPRADSFATAYDPGEVPVLSVSQVREILAAMGWQRDPDGILARASQRMTIDCVIQDTSTCRAIGAEVARQLRIEGIELRLRPVPLFEAFYQAVADRPAAFISKWLWPDAMEAIMGFSRSDCMDPGGGNWQHARCPAVDSAFDSFLAAQDRDGQWVASADAQRAFMTHLPYVPLVSPMESLAVRNRLRGFGLTPGTLYPSYQNLELGLGAA